MVNDDWLSRLLHGIRSGQMLAGVNMPAAEDVGVGSTLPEPRVRRGIGAKGHTFVRHAVVATLLGVTVGMLVRRAVVASSRCNASRGNINFGFVVELDAPDIMDMSGNANHRRCEC